MFPRDRRSLLVLPVLVASCLFFDGAAVWSQERSQSQPSSDDRPVLTDAPLDDTDAPSSEGSAASRDETQRRRSRRGGFSTTELTLGEDRKIELRFDQPTTQDAAYRAIESPVDGKVVAFIENRPLKLSTPVDLSFGEVVVKAQNHGADYPGVYSLWLKNVGGRWRLAFNHLPDVWGTQHDPSKDAAEVPLEVTTLATPVETFTAVLEPAPGGGILRLRWGSFDGSAAFTIAAGN